MASPKPWCGYRRLSQDRDGIKIGPQVQTDSGEGLATREGITIAHWYQDSLTAADESVYREEYEQMLADVAAGLYAGIVVYRCDRLTRLSGEFDRCLKAAGAHGGEIISSDENLRSSKPDDVTMMKLKVLFAEAEVKGMKVRIKANKSKRSATGKYSGGGRRPYGFEAPMRNPDGSLSNSGKIGVAHVATEVANLQHAAQEVAWNKKTYTDVIEEWHGLEPPIYGATGAPWNPSTLETILTSPRMIGQQLHKSLDQETGEVVKRTVKADWEPVLSEETWKRLVALKKTGGARGAKSRYVLSGRIFCGRCGQPLTGCQRMRGRAAEATRVRTYRCRSGTNDKARGACGKLSVIADPVEKLTVAAILLRLAGTDGFNAAQFEESDLHAQLEEANEEIELCNTELEELAAAKADKSNQMKTSEWLAARQPLVARREQAASLRRSLNQRLSVPAPNGADFLDLPEWYEHLSPGQQRKLVEVHVTSVSVLAPGRSGRYFKPDRVVLALADAQQSDGERQHVRVGDSHR